MKVIYKRFLSLSLALMMILSCTMVASAANTGSTPETGSSVEFTNEAGIMPQELNYLVQLELASGCGQNYKAHDTVPIRQRGYYHVILGVAGGSMEITLGINGNTTLRRVVNRGETIDIPYAELIPGDTLSYSLYALSPCAYVVLNIVSA